MQRKGQYLAVETVLVFGLGLLTASATISIVNGFRTDMISTVEKDRVQVVRSQLMEAVTILSQTSPGSQLSSVTVNLPDRIAGREYTMAVNDTMVVEIGGKLFEQDYPVLDRYSFRGSTSGGKTKVYRTGSNMVVGG